jgi:hypothetical protein
LASEGMQRAYEDVFHRADPAAFGDLMRSASAA